ncbi:MAG: hypothetical protein N2648_00550 [Aquificaceae bacterium]|nr:hypothetical protein [Aquificaceae bacterium]MCX7989119.1 hypothetical protein [Aquificaceae bacterium]MDW8032341.1 hypothetical protein [Aquificaceae bacterium]MDW8294071.1 hypothetical protein [Aquificaceae bacterium]
MEKSLVLSALLVQDRLIRLNLQMLEALLKEIRADVEEVNLLAEACLSEEELKKYREVVLKVEAELLVKISEVVDHIYDLYEVFNFDITFLATIPEELGREIERLSVVSSINSRLELIHTILEEIVLIGEENNKLFTILTPFRVYRELIKRSLEFNKGLEELSFQKTG